MATSASHPIKIQQTSSNIETKSNKSKKKKIVDHSMIITVSDFTGDVGDVDAKPEPVQVSGPYL